MSTEKPKYWIFNKKKNIYEPRKLYEFITDPDNTDTKLVRKSVHDVISTDPKWAQFYEEHYLNNTTWKMKVIDDKEYNKIDKVYRNKTEKKKRPIKERQNVTKKAPIEEPQPDKVLSYLDYLYPRLEDEEFNLKLSQHKELYDNQYDGYISSIKEEAENICNIDFELLPHQNFVRNFMSFNTPYNSLLLYHGLGSGKTCSAIGISEEIRKYMKQLGQRKSIIIVASPNVQDNFKSQLFNPKKLKFEGGMWSMNSCVGSSLLEEVNPTSSKDLREQYIMKEIKMLINQYYMFMGYTQFANYINNSITVSLSGLNSKQKMKMRIKKIKELFSNRLIIIDEVHNLRITRDNSESNVKSAEILMTMVEHAENMKLLLLSATPMYNSYEEIIWLTNLMNINDNKSIIKIGDVFNSKGEITTSGRDLLIRKLTGYVSYVRGENPYSFPVRIYANHRDYLDFKYVEPTRQINKKTIKEPLKYIPVFYNSIGAHQKKVYDLLMRNMNTLMKELFENMSKSRTFEDMDSFGYTLLQRPLEILNIVYPNDDFEEAYRGAFDILSTTIQNMVGKAGLSNIMKYTEEKIEDLGDDKSIKVRMNFEYKTDKYGKLFSQSELHKYSAKMSNICKIIQNTEGIILIYSQYIDGGIIPMALALEEMGFSRYSSHKSMKSLLKNKASPVDYISMKPKDQHKGVFHKAKYVMITGDKNYSRTNDADIKYLNSPTNLDGNQVKVVLISKAAAEGIDFKNIRQIHILDPWYNMNRIEQIIGRGVRNLSHCGLPFEKRNVELFLHATNLDSKTEAVDTYVYRVAEKKSIKIGEVTRLLKENSVDCLLNIGQNNFTQEHLLTVPANAEIEYVLPNGKKTQVVVGDKPFTDICDYMDNCVYTCKNEDKYVGKETISTTYNDTFIVTNNAAITKKIKEMFLDIPGSQQGKFFMSHKEIVDTLSAVKSYPHDQINHALYNMVNSENMFLLDKYGRIGKLVNKGTFYFFQPIEITNDSSSIYEREVPVDVKMPHISVDLPIEFKETTDELSDTLEEIKKHYNEAFSTSSNQTFYGQFHKMRKFLTDKYNINEETQRKYIMFHILDEIKFLTKIELMNYIYSKSKLNTIERFIKDYFDEKIVISDKNHDDYGVLLSDDSKTVSVFVYNDGKWEKASFTESRDLLSSKTNITKNGINKSKMNEVIGFFEFNKTKDMYSFKLRHLRDNVNKVGSRIDNMQLKHLIVKLNEIIGEEKYTIDNILAEFKTNKKDLKYRLIILIEFILRHYQETHNRDKVWFFSDEQIIFNKINKHKIG